MSLPANLAVDQIQQLAEQNAGYEVADSLSAGIAMAKVFLECLIRRKLYPFEMTEGGAGRGTGFSTNWSESWVENEVQRVRQWLADPKLLVGSAVTPHGIFGPRHAVRKCQW